MFGRVLGIPVGVVPLLGHTEREVHGHFLLAALMASTRDGGDGTVLGRARVVATELFAPVVVPRCARSAAAKSGGSGTPVVVERTGADVRRDVVSHRAYSVGD